MQRRRTSGWRRAESGRPRNVSGSSIAAPMVAWALYPPKSLKKQRHSWRILSESTASRSTVAAPWSLTVAVPALATTRAPLRSQSSAAEPGSDRKGARVVAKAGTATVKDQEAAAVEKEAVLSEKILHECRCFFNDFGGYRAQATMGAAMLEPAWKSKFYSAFTPSARRLEPLTFRGLPLSALRQPDVRRRARPRRKL